MEWRREKDDEIISSPVFVGMTKMSNEEKCVQLMDCLHEWKKFGLSTSVQDENYPDLVMHTDGCDACNGTRMRITGPEDQIERMFSPLDVEEAIDAIGALVELIDEDVPSGGWYEAPDFFGDIRADAVEMSVTIEEKGEVSEVQESAITNWTKAVKKWIHD